LAPIFANSKTAKKEKSFLFSADNRLSNINNNLSEKSTRVEKNEKPN
jgi:hypothetical protein